ncbi:M23 family metallopeptidase [Streptomyces sp. NPDC101118]|uniref:M23 family metallopeptidase n=1 Tax=Streptomyces sp. NPDC101118 TaxID=3366109 RepID=UPI0037F1E464
MASSRPAPEAAGSIETDSPYPGGTGAGAWGEWNPTEDSARPAGGRHRVAKQRGGLARSSTVLGVGIIAAVGATGMATAQDKPPVAISIPSLLPDDEADAAQESTPIEAPLTNAGVTPEQAEAGTDAGEALRNRILQQAESQADAAVAQEKEAAQRAAEQAAAAKAKAEREAADKKAAEARKAAEAAAKAAAEAKAEAERLAKLAGQYALPTSSYTLTSHYGDSGSMWSSGHHTGLDFAAPTGTPVKAVHGGKIISAGWSGAYGYRIVLQLEDGTEVWYCHLSSMSVTSGTVTTGETIGRVGATGNVTGAHLHLEVRTGGATVDPLAWLRDKGLTV